jgi:transposase
MNVLYERCCGVDVHKRSIVACLIVHGTDGGPRKELRRFGTMTADIRLLKTWLGENGCTHVAMESTGVYWKPIYNLLEDAFTLFVVNARDMRAVPGRKTDIHDAEWIADLLRHGLLKASLIPTSAERHLRDLTRHRTTLIQDRTRCVNRIEKLLEDANIKLTSVVSDILGVSSRSMLRAMVGGEKQSSTLADFALGRLRGKREQLMGALEGEMTSHHCFLLEQLLDQIEFLETKIDSVSGALEEHLRPFEEDLALLDSIPGVGRRHAEVFMAEFGMLVESFPTHRHLSSWARMCPSQNESAGKHRTGKTQPGNRWLRSALVEAAHTAARCRRCYLSAQYGRIAARRGKKRAAMAVGHSILVIAYHVLKNRTPFMDLGSQYFDERDRKGVEKRLVKRLEHLGYNVELTPLPVAA